MGLLTRVAPDMPNHNSSQGILDLEDQKESKPRKDSEEAFLLKRMYERTVDDPCQIVPCSIDDQLDLLTVRSINT